MSLKFNICIEDLGPIRVIVFTGDSKTPEMEAHKHAVGFAKEKGLLDKNNHFKTFGFNKPAPWVTQEEEYGYEIWVVVDSDVNVPPYLMEKTFPGAMCSNQY